MFIQTEATPNPSVLKFLPGRKLMSEGTREFRDAAEAHASPLALDLFDLDGRDASLLRPGFPDGHKG